MNSDDKLQLQSHEPDQGQILSNGEKGAPFIVGSSIQGTQHFNGPQQFTDALRHCIVWSCEQGATELVLCDADFSAWPLDDDFVITALRSWANSTSNRRMLTMVAATYSVIEEQHGMWVRWRKTWDHRVQCKQSPASSAELPCLFWSPHCVLTLFDKTRYGGRVSLERQKIIQEKGRVDEWIRQSSAAFPASTLGLW